MSVWVSLLSYALALLGVALAAAYMYMSRKHDHWRRKGVKYLKPLPFVGNLKDIAFVRRNIGVMSHDIYHQHKKEPYVGIFAFDGPMLHVHDLALVRSVLVKDFQFFCDRNFHVSAKADLLGSRSLFALKGDRWKQSRSAITPSFTSGKMKHMYEIVEGRAKFLAETLHKENTGEPMSAYDLVARYTTDVIASCAFGIDSGTLRDPRAEFRRKLKMIFDLSPTEALRFLMAFVSPNAVHTFNIKVFKKEVEDYVIGAIRQAIRYREEKGVVRNDLLSALVAIMKRTGFETSATTISYALYELAKNKDIQDKLREEINTTLKENGGSVPYDVMHSMKYMDLVFQETLRKYPPVPFLDRVSNRPYRLPGTNVTLDAGTAVMIPVLGIHRDPEIYPNPMQFIPERFLEENKAKRPSCTHMPFGEGPRTCVGLRFALMQTKLGMIHILKDHSVELPSTTPTEPDFTPKSFLLQPVKHLELLFKKIEA
ncbi:Cytochrome P450 6j1 [Gryllus bimaculatus]|nr:Cytochrome P450 6j1 [Gryllus bimaculatus]